VNLAFDILDIVIEIALVLMAMAIFTFLVVQGFDRDEYFKKGKGARKNSQEYTKGP
jgi:hypothetical protein